jgi:glycosyltransferase involved in cell wall biosynthesis
MTVTCIIPVHNAEATIERAVNSAFAAGCDYVLAYDDHSTDDSLHVMCELRAKQWTTVEKMAHEVGVEETLDLWARSGVLHIIGWKLLDDMQVSGLKGVNIARNFLIGSAPWGLIIPLDADDELMDIRPLVEAWQSGSWVYGDYMQQEGLEETLIPGSPAGMLSRKELTGITFAFHKEDWLKVGGYDPDFAYCEDWAFQCALTHAGVQPIYVPTTIYRRHLKANGNERTSRAGLYWNFYHLMARMKYPSVFAVNR